MNILEVNLEELNFKDIKKIVDTIDVDKMLYTKELQDIISRLNSDKRKNIQSLGSKLSKARKKIVDEIARVREMYDFDKSFGEYKIIAGVDEVGRGPLAGPIVSCAVILDLDVLDEELILEINDSKKIPEEKRKKLSEIIKEKSLAYHIAVAEAKEIDEKGIAVCNNGVFLEACNSLKIKPELVLSDGYKVKGIEIANESVIKGDTKSACIAAASIVAKVYRDELMKNAAKVYSNYGFEENVGYGTTKHIQGLKEFGPCDIHRLSFLKNILNNQ